MKRNGLFVLVLALAAVLCAGCGVKDEDLKSDPLVNADGTAPVGSTLVAPAPQDDFVLLDNKDILSANGLYYASWVNGDAQPYENSEGKTVDLYDAQLTLVVQENKTEDKAASAVEGWQTLAQQNYDVMNARYLSQLALVTDMVDASNLKLNAELSEVDARINIVYAYYRMKYVAGEI